jgi:hypothetical protein
MVSAIGEDASTTGYLFDVGIQAFYINTLTYNVAQGEATLS